MRNALVTGSAGFIGHHVCRRLLAEGFAVTGVDALTEHYDVALKRARHARLAGPGFRAVQARIEGEGVLKALFAQGPPEVVVHLAAQTGVRHSLRAPRAHLASNLAGTFALLEAARAHPPAHLLLASSSSVYGANAAMPYAESAPTDAPLSFYAATKKAGEAMSHAYAHLHDLPTTVFRFFTVYGPWGRPDMALCRFTGAILEGRPIELYNRGEMSRDFTYVDDLVEAVRRLIDRPPARPAPDGAPARTPIEGDSLSPVAPWRVVNIGAGRPVSLGALIEAIEAATGREATRRLLPMQPGDVPATWASAELLRRLTGYVPDTPVEKGVPLLVEWYRAHHGISTEPPSSAGARSAST